MTRPASRLSFIWAEVAGALLSVLFLVAFLRDTLLFARTTFDHDVKYWSLPVFQFFADNLLQGRFPYWNPFSHGGEPFYPLVLQLRFLDPVTLVTLGLGGLLTNDLILLFNWDRVVRLLLSSAGSYLLLRGYARHLVTRLSLFPVLLWSSFVATAFIQPAMSDFFLTAPLVAWLLLRILHHGDRRWRTWLGLAVALGSAWQSYHFVGSWLLVVVLVIAFALFRREDLRALRHTPGVVPRVLVTTAVVVLMAAPNVVVLLERDRFVFPARGIDFDYRTLLSAGAPLQYEPGPSWQEDRSIMMPYALVRYSGTAGSVWDFVQLIAPEGSRAAIGNHSPPLWGHPSEAFMYLGLLVYAGALLGLAAGRHPLRAVWLFVGAAFGLLFLGPVGGLHWIAYHAFPPLWLLRHTHLFVNFLILAILFFYVLGADRVVDWRREPLFGPSPSGTGGGSERSRWLTWGWRAVAAVAVFTLALVTLTLSLVSLGRPWPLVGVAALVSIPCWRGLRRRFTPAELFFGGVALHLLLVLWFSSYWTIVLTRVWLCLVLPVAVVALARYARPSLFPAAVAGLLVVLSCDLGDYLATSSIHWSAPRPDATRPAMVSSPVFPATRQTVPQIRTPDYDDGQSIRYLELLERVPAAFTTVRRAAARDGLASDSAVEAVLRAQRWNSFLLLRGYFDLIHSDFPPSLLEEWLAIDRPLLQFRARPTTAPATTSRAGIDVIEYDYNSLILSVSAPGAGLLYHADGYDTHWRATVDGVPASVLRANVNFKALALPPGSHRVTFSYEPQAFRASLYVYYGVPAVLLAVGAVALVSRARALASARGLSRPRERA